MSFSHNTLLFKIVPSPSLSRAWPYRIWLDFPETLICVLAMMYLFPVYTWQCLFSYFSLFAVDVYKAVHSNSCFPLSLPPFPPLIHPSSLPSSLPLLLPSFLPSSLFHTDASVSQVAIAWLLYQPSVVSVVIGARTVEQLEDNLQSVNLQLSKEEVSPQSLPHNTLLGLPWHG